MALSPSSRLLALALLRGLALAHGAALLLLSLAGAAEGLDEPVTTLARRLSVQVPHTWALLAPALTLCGCALAAARLRSTGQLLALASLGVGRGPLRLAGFLAGTLVAACAVGLGASAEPSTEVVRVLGGWWVRGQFVGDDPGALAVPPASSLPRWAGTGWLCALGGWAGVELGAARGAAVVVVASATLLCFDLVARGYPVGDAPIFAVLALSLPAAVTGLRSKP